MRLSALGLAPSASNAGDARAPRREGDPTAPALSSARSRRVDPVHRVLAALVPRLALVPAQPGCVVVIARITACSALVARLSFIAELARRLIRQSRARSCQPKRHPEKKYRNLAPHTDLLTPPEGLSD
jgi:hypothetical protein